MIGRHLLFFAGDHSFEQHRGLMPFSNPELASWANQLEARRQWLASSGAHFLFVIAPDKQSIYPEDVPARLSLSGKSPADEFVAYLHEHTQVDVLDLRGPLRAARARGPVFAATESHWNDRGVVTAYIAIVQRLQTWFPKLTPRSEARFARYPMRRWRGDLARLMPGLAELVGDTGEQWQPVPPLAPEVVASDGYRPPQSLHYAVFDMPTRSDLPRAVIFHDSFWLAAEERVPPEQAALLVGALALPASKLYPQALLAEQFSRSAFTWQRPFDAELVEHEHPDVVIEEYAERLVRFGPEGTVPALPH